MRIEDKIKQIADKYKSFDPHEYTGSIPTKLLELSGTVLDRFVHEVENLMEEELYDLIYHEEYDIRFIGMSRTANDRMEAYFAIAWIEGNAELEMCTIKLKSAKIIGGVRACDILTGGMQ